MNRLDVYYDGIRMGELALPPNNGIFFEYSPEFLASGLDLSPLRLPLVSGAQSRHQPATVTLHGLFEDSLPDSWGTRIMNDWFKAKGLAEPEVTPLMRLAYIGERGFGALSYTPPETVAASEGGLGELYVAASAFDAGEPVDLDRLAAVGSSAGGARPKVAVWISESTGQITSRAASPDAQAWLVKFDTTPGRWFGRMEFAYSLMCRAAGCDFPETKLLTTEHEDGPRQHFAVRRFDRVGARRLHYHSLAAMYQITAGDLDYQTFLRVTRRITADHREAMKGFRRAVFNVLASNRDDHGKNQGYLYENRQWRLSPAFDVTHASAERMPERGMAVLGERRTAGLKQLHALAQAEGLEKKEVASVIEEVRSALVQWPRFAAEAGLPAEITASIQRSMQVAK
jgi:serine/threonine-protein kinase HipA